MYLYFIRSGNKESDPIKIGVSVNPEFRMKSLQVGNPYKLELLHKTWMLDRRCALETEKKLHSLYSDYKLEGEWFDNRMIKQIKK